MIYDQEFSFASVSYKSFLNVDQLRFLFSANGMVDYVATQ